MAMKTKSTAYIQQRRRQFRRVEVLDSSPAVVSRRAQNHFDLIRRNITDGCVSTTSIFDSECGDVPSVFDPRVTRFELADELLRSGHLSKAQKMAADGTDGAADS